MTVFLVGLIISVVVLLIGIVLLKANVEYSEYIAGFAVLALIFLVLLCIIHPISLNKERNRQLKEKQQIEYQIENLTEDKDKIKLNEWILTYNDWVNDVNAEKETWGWFAWHWNFDMSEFEIIDLV